MESGTISIIIMICNLIIGIVIQFPISFLFGVIETRYAIHIRSSSLSLSTQGGRSICIIAACRLCGYVLFFIILHRFVEVDIVRRLSIMIVDFVAVPQKTSTSYNTSNNTALQLLLALQSMIITYYGIYYGQLFCPIAITGGIATGKSTVVQQLRDNGTHNNHNNDNNNNNNSNNNIMYTSTNDTSTTFYIIDTDSIGHGILLSPQRIRLLQQQQQELYSSTTTTTTTNNINNSNITSTKYHHHHRQPNILVTPKDSVYDEIIKAFGNPNMNNTNIFYDTDNKDNKNTNNNNSQEIDRRKLGDIIFQNPHQRSILNRITHPKIIKVLLRQLVYGTYYYIHEDHNTNRTINPNQDRIRTIFKYSIRLLLQPISFIFTKQRQRCIVCVDIPLYYESKSLSMYQYLFSSCIIIVACAPDVQIQRLQQRNTDLTYEQCQQRIASQIPIDEKVRLYGLPKSNTIVIYNDGTKQALQQEVKLGIMELQQRLNCGQVDQNFFLIVLLLYISIYFLVFYSVE